MEFAMNNPKDNRKSLYMKFYLIFIAIFLEKDRKNGKICYNEFVG